jgi:hypothetical protein
MTIRGDVLKASIDFIFPAIGMALEDPRVGTSYTDAEFQMISHLFYEGHILNHLMGRDIDRISLIILHIHTDLDPCSVYAEILCKLSQTLNYFPEKMLPVDYWRGQKECGKVCDVLCKKLKSHGTKFLIEVSSERPYLNSREAGVDQLFLEQSKQGSEHTLRPIVIPSRLGPLPSIEYIRNNVPPDYYFPPFVVFMRLNGLPQQFILPSIKPSFIAEKEEKSGKEKERDANDSSLPPTFESTSKMPISSSSSSSSSSMSTASSASRKTKKEREADSSPALFSSRFSISPTMPSQEAFLEIDTLLENGKTNDLFHRLFSTDEADGTIPLRNEFIIPEATVGDAVRLAFTRIRQAFRNEQNIDIKDLRIVVEEEVSCDCGTFLILDASTTIRFNPSCIPSQSIN